MHILILILTLLGLNDYPTCYSVKPSPFLKEYISQFRGRYGVEDSEAIVMETWEDSTHTYYSGIVIDGNEIMNDRDLIITRTHVKNDLYRSRGRKIGRRIDRSAEYDDMVSFVICFHKDKTVCNLMSYEISPLNGIPVLEEMEKVFNLEVPDCDPDVNVVFGMVDHLAKMNGDVHSLGKEVTELLRSNGIEILPDQRPGPYVLLVVNPDGKAHIETVRHFETDDMAHVINCLTPLIQSQEYVPATHRGIHVASYLVVPFMY